jgi:oligosaccharyltransferase complex subunit beta
VFKLVLDHRRRGWTTLKAVTVVTVVPPRHDGYPPFLSAGWPVYAAVISTSVGFLIFSALWLAGDDARDRKKGKSTKARRSENFWFERFEVSI